MTCISKITSCYPWETCYSEITKTAKNSQAYIFIAFILSSPTFPCFSHLVSLFPHHPNYSLPLLNSFPPISPILSNSSQTLSHFFPTFSHFLSNFSERFPPTYQLFLTSSQLFPVSILPFSNTSHLSHFIPTPPTFKLYSTSSYCYYNYNFYMFNALFRHDDNTIPFY